MDLHTPLKKLGRTYSINAGKMEKLNVFTIKDLLWYIPHRYDDYTIISPINIIQVGETVTIKGRIVDTKNEFTRSRITIQKVQLEDETGIVECMWFNQPYIIKSLQVGQYLSLSGRAEKLYPKPQIMVKDYEPIEAIDSPTYHTGRLVPVYGETRGLTSKWIRNRVKDLLESTASKLEEYLPLELIEKHNLPLISEVFQMVHFPNSFEEVQKAKDRLAFDELFFMQLAGMKRRSEWQSVTTAHQFPIHEHKTEIDKLYENIPFDLTEAQKKAVEEIFTDLNSTKPMNRMLEGDVGSGKTIVAAIAMYAAYVCGYQSVLMAPTEILAQQHYNSITKLLEPLGVKIGLRTSGSKKAGFTKQDSRSKNKKVHESSIVNLESSPDILIGTHAVIHDKVKFDKLGLVVIDEQQRFGVEQRTILREKGANPHFLTMTATPIPRTVFLTMYGDLDLSYLNEMPKGRQRIKTWLVPEVKRDAGYEWIKEKIDEKDEKGIGNQVFIICPFIEESESLTTIKAASAEYERLQSTVFKKYKLGLLHGKMKSKEKDTVLADFNDKKFDILVATPVVEVGIDIPNATIMVIEAAERFGLAQLHQLRGRVGRGSKQSFCLLFTESSSDKTTYRLKSLERIYFGPELAELDLKLRGPGQLYGTQQSGRAFLKVASFADFSMIEKAKEDATTVFRSLNSYPNLLEQIKDYNIEKVAPD